MTIAYFGAAGCAEAYCANTNTLPDIFVDNDSKKWGSSVSGVKVCNPSVLLTLKPSKIVITSSYIKDILPQLLEMGIQENIIEVPTKSLLSLKLFETAEVRMTLANRLNGLMSLQNIGHKIVAVGGTALGFCRGGDFILWDDDVDLFAPIEVRSELIQKLNDQHIEVVQMSNSVMHSILFYIPVLEQVKVPVSIDFFESKGASFIDIFEDYSWEWRTEMFTNCHVVNVHGYKLNVPNPPGEYLSCVYGDSWATPNPEFGYSDYQGTI